MLSEWWLVTIVVTALALAASAYHATQRFDAVIYDKMSLIDPVDVDPSILIIAIDEQSLTEFGRWPWTRDLDAKLVHAIQRSKPKAVIFDVLFNEPSDSDRELADAMRTGAPVFLPLTFEIPGRNGRPFDITKPVVPILQAAAGTGHVNLVAGEDGVVRHVRLWDGEAQNPVPHLIVAMTRALNGERESASGGPPSHSPMIVPFAGPAGTYPTISAAAVLKGELPPDLARNRIVFIGATASGLNDWHPVSADGGGGAISGVELQANLLAALKARRLIRDATPLERAIFTLVPLSLLLVTFRRYAPRTIVKLMAVLLVMIGAVSVIGLIFGRIWLAPATPMFALMLAYPIWGWRRLAAIHDFLITEIEKLSLQEPPAQLEQSIAPLDQVSWRARLLHNAIDMMRQAQRQREMALQFLSHDMRAPQNLILAVINSAPAHLIAPEMAERIKAYSTRTLELADNFVSLARAESDAYRFELVNLHDLLIEAIDHVWPLARKADVSIVSPETETEVLTEGDGAKLFRVLVNILLNAIRHSPPRTKIHCTLGQELAGSTLMAICSIMDEGEGVPAERREWLFTPFLATETSGRDANGIGLGLAFSQTVIHRHGGTISYEHGPGAKFVIALPLFRHEANFRG